MAREARHFVDEAFFVIFGKSLAEFSKKFLNFVRQPYYAISHNALLGIAKVDPFAKKSTH